MKFVGWDLFFKCPCCLIFMKSLSGCWMSLPQGFFFFFKAQKEDRWQVHAWGADGQVSGISGYPGWGGLQWATEVHLQLLTLVKVQTKADLEASPDRDEGSSKNNRNISQRHFSYLELLSIYVGCLFHPSKVSVSSGVMQELGHWIKIQTFILVLALLPVNCVVLD